MPLADRWLERLPAAVGSVWADALPACVLHAWWGQGERARCYLVARSLPATKRAQWLAWFAAIDPEPLGKPAYHAACEALAGASSLTVSTVASLVPLSDPRLLRLA